MKLIDFTFLKPPPPFNHRQYVESFSSIHPNKFPL